LLLLKCKANNGEILIIGYHGRKGIKNDITIMGTTVYNTVFNIKIPTIITKYCYERTEEKGFNYLVCLDGS